MRPRVLVLLAAYNGEPYIREQIESVLAQEGDFDLSVRVRDDGSRDGTVRVVEELTAEHPGRIELIRGENAGYNANFFTLLDGASGTLLWEMARERGIDKVPVWQYNVTHPELVRALHDRYVGAGTRLLFTNTFVVLSSSSSPLSSTQRQRSRSGSTWCRSYIWPSTIP